MVADSEQYSLPVFENFPLLHLIFFPEYLAHFFFLPVPVNFFLNILSNLPPMGKRESKGERVVLLLHSQGFTKKEFFLFLYLFPPSCSTASYPVYATLINAFNLSVYFTKRIIYPALGLLPSKQD